MSSQNQESGDDGESSSLSSTEPPASPDCQQQKNSPLTIEEASPVPEDVFEARIVVHSALHLQMERAVPPSVYVTLHPHPNVDKVSTSAVSNEQNMIWDHHCVTYIPNMYLQPQVLYGASLYTSCWIDIFCSVSWTGIPGVEQVSRLVTTSSEWPTR